MRFNSIFVAHLDQLVEQKTEALEVAGSNPAVGIYFLCSIIIKIKKIK